MPRIITVSIFHGGWAKRHFGGLSPLAHGWRRHWGRPMKMPPAPLIIQLSNRNDTYSILHVKLHAKRLLTQTGRSQRGCLAVYHKTVYHMQTDDITKFRAANISNLSAKAQRARVTVLHKCTCIVN